MAHLLWVNGFSLSKMDLGVGAASVPSLLCHKQIQAELAFLAQNVHVVDSSSANCALVLQWVSNLVQYTIWKTNMVETV